MVKEDKQRRLLESPKKQSRDKVARQVPDLLSDQLAKLRAAFPEAFVEGKVEVAKLRAALGESVDTGPERFIFSWAGRRNSAQVLQMPTRATLIPVKDESLDFDGTRNLFIEGENLEVLKLLYKPYFGRVKMIYIDPPYNTGTDRVYADNYSDPLASYLQYTQQETFEGDILTSNPETGGRFHSAWLSMMHPRLFFAKQLLTDDGAIFVSIDDHEVHNLRMLMNEIFGEENFVAEFVWEGAIKNDSRFVSISHDYVICYAKNREHLRGNDAIWRTRKEGIDQIYVKVEELKKRFGKDFERISQELHAWYGQLTKNDSPWQHRHYNRIDERGVYFPGDISWPGGGGPKFEIRHPRTRKPVRVPTSGWRFTKRETIEKLIEDGRVEFGPDETKVPTMKRYLHETEGQVLPSVFYKDRRAAMQRLRRLMGDDVFENPKDEEILATLVEAVTEKNDIILDFFAGSGSTAHAVLLTNLEDEGKRRFIMVQLQEPTPKDSTARARGYKTIAAIGKERIRRAMKGVKADVRVSADLGFKVFRLAESNYKPWKGIEDKTPEKYAAEMEAHVDPLVKGWKKEHVIYEVAIKEGLSPNLRIEREKNYKDNEILRVTDEEKGQSFFVCLDDKVSKSTIKNIELKQDDMLVCRDIALDDTGAANLALQCRLKTI